MRFSALTIDDALLNLAKKEGFRGFMKSPSVLGIMVSGGGETRFPHRPPFEDGKVGQSVGEIQKGPRCLALALVFVVSVRLRVCQRASRSVVLCWVGGLTHLA